MAFMQEQSLIRWAITKLSPNYNHQAMTLLYESTYLSVLTNPKELEGNEITFLASLALCFRHAFKLLSPCPDLVAPCLPGMDPFA